MLRLIARVTLKCTSNTARTISRPLAILVSNNSPLVGQKLESLKFAAKENIMPKIWTTAEHKKAKKLLKQGFSVSEIATTLKKSEIAVKWSISLKGEDSLTSTSGALKKGSLDGEEIEYIRELWKHGYQPSIIAKHLGRYINSMRQLDQLTQQIISDDMQSIHQGPQELSPELEESIFQARLKELWDGLFHLEMTETWKEMLSNEPPESWLSDISKLIPKEVKKLLASHEPPSVAKLGTLPWIPTEEAGVYGWLLTPKTGGYINSHCYVYIGSGCKFRHGVEGRRQDHLSSNNSRHNIRLLRLIKRKNLQREGHFFTLMTLKMHPPEQIEKVTRMRYLITLAEAIFTMWLGALGERGLSYERNLSYLYPWGVTEVPYNGCSSHNPLTVEINAPIDDSSHLS